MANNYLHVINPRELGMDLHSYGSHSGSTSSVGDAERLMKIEVGHISTIVSGTTETHLGVHVSSINIHLSPMLMYVVADLTDAILKHPTSGGVGDHHGC